MKNKKRRITFIIYPDENRVQSCYRHYFDDIFFVKNIEAILSVDGSLKIPHFRFIEFIKELEKNAKE